MNLSSSSNENKSVILLTTRFPFGNGEQFLDEEISILRSEGLKVTVFPMYAGGEVSTKRSEIPYNLSCSINYLEQVSCFFSGILDRVFWGELAATSVLIFKPLALLKLILFIGRSKFIESQLSTYLGASNQENTIIYSYWAMESAYACALLKEENSNCIAVTRCHGYDVYESRQINSYMPLKKAFLDVLDRVFPCSENAVEYIKTRYPVEGKNVILSRLGSVDHDFLSSFNDGETLSILSCSSLVKVKRIDKIIEAVKALSETHDNIIWTHIGGGPESDSLIKLARKSGVDVCWLGQLEFSEIVDFYKAEPIDCFINLSDSEGVPVSMMEAISFGVPVVALDVGGVSELVNDRTGILLPSQAPVEDVCNGISMVCQKNCVEYRQSIKELWRGTYSAEKNYRDLVTKIRSL